MSKTSTTTFLFCLGLAACASSPETPPGMSPQALDNPEPAPDASAVANAPSGGAVRDANAEDAKSGGSGDYTVGEPVFVTGPARLRDALAVVNGAIRSRQLPARVLTVPALESWFREGEYFQWTKSERQLLDEQFAARRLPAGWTLSLEQIVGLPGDPWRINLCGPEPENGG